MGSQILTLDFRTDAVRLCAGACSMDAAAAAIFRFIDPIETLELLPLSPELSLSPLPTSVVDDFLFLP